MQSESKEIPNKVDQKSIGPHLWQLTAVRESFAITAAILFLFIAYKLSVIFTPVLLALLAAYLIHPVVKLIERRAGLSPRLSVTILIIFNCTAIAILGFWLWPILGHQIKVLISALPAYLTAVSTQINDRLKSFGIGYEVTDLFQFAISGTGRVVDAASQVAKNVGDIFLGLTIWLTCFFAFATQSSRLTPYLSRWLPTSMSPEFQTVLDILDRSFAGFFRGRVVIAVITSFLFSLAWNLTGVPFWLLLGILAAIFNIIPYLSTVVWIAALVANYGDVLIKQQALDLTQVFLWPSLAFGVVQFIEGWVLTPLIQGKEANLSTPTIIIAIAIGGISGGVVGMLLAVPLTAALKMLAEKYILRPKQS